MLQQSRVRLSEWKQLQPKRMDFRYGTPGFRKDCEIFELNSLQQLRINFLQQFFNNRMFKLEE